MIYLVAGLLLLGLAWFGLRAFARMDPRQAAKWSRAVLGLGAIAAGGLMTLRGLGVIGVPAMGLGLGLLGGAFGLRPKPNRGQGQAGGQGQGTPPPRAGAMSRREALEVLGLEEGATEAEIRAAYRTQMKRNHPDTGGTPALARRIQEARDTLLR